MISKKIGILDSGVGGVSILREIIKLLPNAEYFYLSDSKNSPYGDKSENEIIDLVTENICFLKEHDCQIIVLACNTATTVAIEIVRSKFPNLTIIGTEPAIKMVYDYQMLTDNQNILLLATKGTIESKRTSQLLNNYPVKNLIPIACVGLADLIEQGKLEEVDNYIKTNLVIYGVGAIILGCTHYPLVKPLFEKYFPKALIFDGSVGVAKQVVRKAKEINLLSTTYSLEFCDTENTSYKREQFIQYFTPKK